MKQTLEEKKSDLIDIIIEDLDAEIYDSREYIFALVREALMTRKLSDLKEQANQID